MLKAVIYSRVSTDEQVNEGKSIEVQIDVCKKWVKENGYSVVGVYRDEGKSATTLKGRNGLQEAIIQCQGEKIDALLVLDTDRLARNPADHFLIKSSLAKRGTKIIPVCQPMIDDSIEGNLIETIMAGVNAFQSQLTGRKVRKTLEKKCEMGDFPGWAPLGYLNVNKGTEEKPNRVIEKDEARAGLITELFRLYSTGNYSVDDLSEIVYKMGLVSKNHKKLCRSILYSILNNIFYTKKFLFKGQIFNGNHPALVSPELFETCQRVMQLHNQNACRKRKYRWLLSGYAYCNIHNSRLYGDWNHKKKKAYYHGSTQRNCNHYIPLGELEEKVVQEFEKMQFSEEFIQRIIDKAKELVRQSRENRNQEVENLRNAIKQLENKRNVLEDNLMDQTIDKETFKRKHNELEIQIQNLENDIATIENQGGFDIDVISELLSLIKNIRTTYEKSSFDAKRHYLSMFFEKIDVEGKDIVKATYTPLFQNLVEAKGVRIASNLLPRLDSNQQPSS